MVTTSILSLFGSAAVTSERIPFVHIADYIVDIVLIIISPFDSGTATCTHQIDYLGRHFFDTSADPVRHRLDALFLDLRHPRYTSLSSPALPFASEFVPFFAKTIFRYTIMRRSSAVHRFLGLGMSAHHMFTIEVSIVPRTHSSGHQTMSSGVARADQDL